MWIFTTVALVLSVAVSHAEDSIKSSQWSSIKDKSVLVTGAARGIGKASADRFLDKGAKRVIIVDKLKKLGEETTKILNDKYGKDKVVFIHADVITDMEKVFEYLESNKMDDIDILFNNAGVLNEYDPKLTISTNLLAPIQWATKLYEKTRKDKGGKGCTIINMSDVYGYYVDPFLSVYKAACTGIISYSETIGHQYRHNKTDVRMMTICPNLTNTTMIHGPLEKEEFACLFEEYLDTWEVQSADDVALSLMDIMEEGVSGETYTIEAGKYFKSPDTEYYSAEYVKSFEKRCE